MNSHENEPNRGPEREQLPDYEIDLTGSVEQPAGLLDVIGDAIVEAGDEGEVPDWGARVMARYLANIVGGTDSGLHHFAVTEHGDHDEMFDELAELWEQYSDDELVGEIINRLGTYLVGVGRTARAAQDADSTEVPHKDEYLAFAAFQQLPDVTEATLPEAFHEAYYRSFASLEAVAEHVAEDNDAGELLRAWDLPPSAKPDSRHLLALAHQRWDIVQLKGRFYLFEK